MNAGRTPAASGLRQAGSTASPAETLPGGDPGAARRAPDGVVAVVPSIDAARVERLARTWGADLARRGVRVVVVANAASLADAAPPQGIELVTSRHNAGFAASVNLAAAGVDGWRWLLVLNDDLDPDPDAVTAMLAAVAAADGPDADRPELVVLDPERPRAIPGASEVFANLSLLGDLRDRLLPHRGGRRSTTAVRPGAPGTADPARPGAGDVATLPAGTYTSFSAVAISRRTWDELGALEERLPFCYEDAEYTRRFARATGRAPRSAPCDVGHARSASTRSYIDRVLPVVAFSAFRYLGSTIGTSRARVVVVTALLARLPLVPAASAPARRHVTGLARAVVAVLRDRRPELPAFEEL